MKKKWQKLKKLWLTLNDGIVIEVILMYVCILLGLIATHYNLSTYP